MPDESSCMKIKVKRDGRPTTAEELRCAVEGEPLPPIFPELGKWSDTPRTAAEAFRINTESKNPCEDWGYFARCLELELKESNASHGKTLLMCEQTINNLRSKLKLNK